MQTLVRNKNHTMPVRQLRRLYQQRVKLTPSIFHRRRLLLDELAKTSNLGLNGSSPNLKFGNLDSALCDRPHEAFGVENMIDDQCFFVQEGRLEFGQGLRATDRIHYRVAGTRARQLYAATNEIQHCSRSSLFTGFERLACGCILRKYFSCFIVNGLQVSKETGLELLTAKFRSQFGSSCKRLFVAVDCTLNLIQPLLRDGRPAQ